MSELNITQEQRITVPWRLILIFVLFTAGIISIGITYYKSQRNRIFKENQNNLTAISTLKIGQIVEWHAERLGDASVIRDNGPLVKSIRLLFSDSNQPAIRKELTLWMRTLLREYDYNGISIIDTSFKELIGLTYSDSVKSIGIRKELADVFMTKNVIMTDIQRTSTGSPPHLDLLIPLLDLQSKNHPVFGVIILRIDPEKSLFPLIQSWPTSSKGSETLIFRKEGDSVLYINELLHLNNTSLNLKRSITDNNLLASKAVLGKTGVTEGIDYRNVPVIGYLAQIPDFPWYLVAKTDKEELQAPLRRQFFITVIGIILLLLLNASIFIFWIWDQRVKLYRVQVKDKETLRESDEKFNVAFRMSPVTVTISSVADNKFKDINNTFLEEMEYKREEVIGRTAKELAIWVDESERLGIINELKAKGKVFGKTISYRTKTGKIIFGLTSMSVVHINGEPCNISTVINITETIKAEAKLKESEELYSKLFRNMLNGFAYCKMFYEEGFPTDFVYLSVNEAFEFHTGLKNVSGKMVSEVIPGIQKSDPELLERYGRVASTGIPEVFETYVEALKMWFSISVYSPQKEYFVAIFDVINERKKAEEDILNLNALLEKRVSERTSQLEEANKELEAFSYSVSHDLRAPLRAVHGYSKILLEEYENKLDDEGKRICGIITSSATQMGELIDDLLSFSRIGRSSLNPAILDMKSLAESVSEECRNNILKINTNLNIGKLHNVFADAKLIRQVWSNLISNALKYSSKTDAPEIIIGSKKEGQHVTYFIKDNGVGFDMQYKHKLFGVFQRLHTEKEFEGNGVGLAIVQRIVNKHGGKVWAEGEVNKGATFYFSLPVQEIDKKTHDSRLTANGI